MTKHEDDKATDAAKGDVAEKMAEEQEQGYFGTKVDPLPNEAYSLESGPDSPSQAEMSKAQLEQRLEDTKES